MANHTALARFGRRYGAILVATALLSACAGRTQAPPPASADTAPPPAAQAPATPAPALPPNPIKESAALTYTVKRGDTLWDIADYFLKDPWLWPQIWYENPNIHNPHLIYPGDVIQLSYVNGRPRLQVTQRTIRVSPHVRTAPLDQAIPTIPISAIRDFLRGPRLVDQQALDSAPYVLAFGDTHLVGASGNKVYIRHWSESEPRQLSVLHRGRAYRDPDTDELLGFEAIHVADATIEREGDPAVGVLSNSTQEVQIGDRLLPQEPDGLGADFRPRAPDKPVAGHIISVFNGVSQIARYQIVTLDLGNRDGVQRGDVLTVLQAGRTVDDPYSDARVKLPEQKAGLVMIFKVYDRLSYALVMKAGRPIHVLDAVRSPNMSLAQAGS